MTDQLATWPILADMHYNSMYWVLKTSLHFVSWFVFNYLLFTSTSTRDVASRHPLMKLHFP